MYPPSIADLIELLQATLKHSEQDQDDLSPENLSFLELKRSIVCVLAELELTRLKNAA
jgi:hypothetical protein